MVSLSLLKLTSKRGVKGPHGPSSGSATVQLIWLTGWETLCANYMAMSIWFALLERYDIRSTFDVTIIWIWLRYRYVHLRSKLSLFHQTKK